MRKLIFVMTVLLVSISSATYAQTDTFRWAVQAGGTTSDIGTAITADGSGNIIITGSFSGTAMFGNIALTSAGPLGDIFVAKSDNNGNFPWAVKAGGISVDSGYGITTDGSGNIIVVGAFAGTATFENTNLTSSASDDIFIAKYDGNGNLLWVRSDGGTQLDRANSVVIDDQGNCLVTGYFSETASFGDSTFVAGGQYDVFIAKYDMNGNFIWAKQAGGPFFDEGNDIAVDPQGDVFITGRFSNTAAFGDTSLTSTRLFNSFVAKYDTDGNFLWARKAGGRDDFAYGIATDNLGNSMVTGYFQQTGNFSGTSLTSAGSGDIYVAKYDPDGELLWVRQAGGGDLDQGFAIASDNSGNVAVSGFFVGTATFGDTTLTSTFKDVFIAKYDTDGNLIQVAQTGDAGSEEANGIATDGLGNTYITGLFEGPVSFGTTMLNSPGQVDIFLAKFGMGDVTGIRDEASQPHSFTLSQNYPNPFNPSTTISYSMQQSGEVELTVFNALGQTVRTLVNGTRTAGEYTLTWDGRDDAGQLLSSGSYFYRLQVGDAVQTRRMLLLR